MSAFDDTTIEAIKEALGESESGDASPTGSIPDYEPGTGFLPDDEVRRPQMFGGGDDEDQIEIWEKLARGEFGPDAQPTEPPVIDPADILPTGVVPDDAEIFIPDIPEGPFSRDAMESLQSKWGDEGG